jgi:hypothetical protein
MNALTPNCPGNLYQKCTRNYAELLVITRNCALLRVNFWHKFPGCEEFILFFFNKLLELMKIPKNFNVSIIKPILKDQEKPTDDINNIRPISISNCFSQIF